MTDQARQRSHSEALDRFLVEQAGYVRYRRSQFTALRGRPRDANGARPPQFDESGFPIRQGRPGFPKRLARLLSPF